MGRTDNEPFRKVENRQLVFRWMNLWGVWYKDRGVEWNEEGNEMGKGMAIPLHYQSNGHSLQNKWNGQKGQQRMEKYFGNAYRGDPGVPHSGAERFENIWIGSAAFSVLTWFNPYMWQLSNQYNWHDKAMMFEHYHWKKAMAKNQPYQFKWNQYMDADLRESYYFNWPVYFP